MGKIVEGSSQGTCINCPWTWTTGWGLTVGAGGGQGRTTRENWDNYNRTTIKNRKFKEDSIKPKNLSLK